MLQKGIIIGNVDKYTVKVRVPKYDKLESSLDGTPDDELSTGIVCTLPGMNLTYSAGDIVLVDFENDELTKPVILGLLYREHESNSVLEIDGVDSDLEDIYDTLSDIEDRKLYTHIKYSNDNGVTFTSLYDPTYTVENKNYSISNSPSQDIIIDSGISTIYWSITNDKNVDVTNSIPITTTINGYNKFNDVVLSYTTQNKLIEAPFGLSACVYATISYNISMNKKEAANYYICLTTDKNSIGSVYGDYIGIQVSNDIVPSVNTVDYSWTSTMSRSEYNIDSLKKSLLRRIRTNEIDIRGYAEDSPNEDSGNGLLEAINIEYDTITVGTGDRNRVYFGDTNQYVYTTDSSLHINAVVQNEFEWKRIYKEDKPNAHLVLNFNG